MFLEPLQRHLQVCAQVDLPSFRNARPRLSIGGLTSAHVFFHYQACRCGHVATKCSAGSLHAGSSHSNRNGKRPITTPSPRLGAARWLLGFVASHDHRLPQTTKSPNFVYQKRFHAYFCYLLMRTYPNSDFHAISSHSLPLGFGGSE